MTTIASVYIQGSSPLLMNPMTEEVLDGLITGVAKPRAKDRTREDVAKEKLYRDETTNKIGIPSVNVFACLVEAGRYLDLAPRKKISTKESTLLPSFLTIKEFFLPFVLKDDNEYDAETAWKADARRGVLNNGGKKVAVPIIRPRFDKWGFWVTVEIDEGVAKPDLVRRLFEIAGRNVGLCDFRPAKRGPFGMFKVAQWQVMQAEDVDRAEVVASGPSSDGLGSERELAGAR